uniref:(northern house mosquito) hypothetical protein n=1 Tax=Culex pipiens TaxID=7175 RepID=A0A8D8J7T1_CULPI
MLTFHARRLLKIDCCSWRLGSNAAASATGDNVDVPRPQIVEDRLLLLALPARGHVAVAVVLAAALDRGVHRWSHGGFGGDWSGLLASGQRILRDVRLWFSTTSASCAVGGSILGRNNVLHVLAILGRCFTAGHGQQTSLATGLTGRRVYHSRWMHFLRRH